MEILQQLLETPIIDKSVTDIMQISKGVALKLGGTFFMINLAYNYAIHAFKKNPSFLDYSAVARGVIILILISLFEFWMYPVKELLGGLINAFSVDTNDVVTTELLEKFNSSTNSASKELKDPGIYDVLNHVWNFFSNMMSSIITTLLTPITFCIYFIIKIFLMVIVKAMYIAGPLALLASLIPIWKDNMSAWFSNFVGSSCILVSQNILLKLQFVFLGHSLTGSVNNTSIDPASVFWGLILNVVIIAAHISVFWYTKLWIQSGSAGQVFSNAINAASTMAGLKMGGMLPQRDIGISNSADNAADVFKNKS